MSFKNKVSKTIGILIAPMLLWVFLIALLCLGVRLWLDLISDELVIEGYRTGLVVDWQERGIFWKSDRYIFDDESYAEKEYCVVSDEVDDKLFCAFLDDKKVRIIYEDASFSPWKKCNGEQYVVKSVEAVDGSELTCEY